MQKFKLSTLPTVIALVLVSLTAHRSSAVTTQPSTPPSIPIEPACDFAQMKSTIERNNDRNQSFIPITLADSLKRVNFIPLNVLTSRLRKNNLDKDLDSVEGLYLLNGITNSITKKSRDNNIHIYMSNRGVNEINYYFLSNGRDKNPKIAHKILDSEKPELIKYLNLVTDNRHKSQAILRELETQYQTKLANKDLVQNRLIVADVEKNGRLFELQGSYRCRDEAGDCWCIFGTINELVIK